MSDRAEGFPQRVWINKWDQTGAAPTHALIKYEDPNDEDYDAFIPDTYVAALEKKLAEEREKNLFIEKSQRILVASLQKQLAIAVEALDWIGGGCLVPPDGGTPYLEDAVDSAREALEKIQAGDVSHFKEKSDT